MTQQLEHRPHETLKLPPRDVWLFEPDRDDRLPTPVDERGLVDISSLISLVKSTVAPEFTWKPSEKPNEHHLYWDRSRYPNEPEARQDPSQFRDLATNKIVVPTMFHNWIHKVTEAPPVPSEETMFYRVEAQRVVTTLFRLARESMRLTRTRYITDERLERGLTWHYSEFCYVLDTATSKIPIEFQPPNLTSFWPERDTDVHQVVPTLGRMALTSTRVREVTRPLAA